MNNITASISGRKQEARGSGSARAGRTMAFCGFQQKENANDDDDRACGARRYPAGRRRQSTAAQPCELNDRCRAGTLREAKTVFTRGCIDSFCDPGDPLSLFTVQSALLAKVRAHDCSADEDPHGERDFGVFEHEGEKLYWKIDYYDPSLSFGSDEPSDVAQTMRVLTILLASEY
jgi:hypothetical protein